MSLFIKNRETLLRLHEGPLGPYIDDYAAELQEEGYAQHSAELRIGLVADFNQWLAKRRIPAPQITTAHFQPYLRFRARYRPPQRGAPAALKRLLDLLLRQGVIPEPSLPPATPAEKLRDEFCLYLRQGRALASATLIAYRPFVGEFLTGRFGTGPVNLASLSAADVIGFVQRRAASIHSKQVQLLTTALRSFLRFAHYRGNVHTDLAACVPSVANWSQSNIPKAFPSGQVKHVLAACNRRTAVGRRDYAILLLLARLGLRAGEIRTLTLEDLDWPAGLITVRGKGAHDSPMPLPPDVGEAIAGYLRKGRPPTASRCLFLRAREVTRRTDQVHHLALRAFFLKSLVDDGHILEVRRILKVIDKGLDGVFTAGGDPHTHHVVVLQFFGRGELQSRQVRVRWKQAGQPGAQVGHRKLSLRYQVIHKAGLPEGLSICGIFQLAAGGGLLVAEFLRALLDLRHLDLDIAVIAIFLPRGAPQQKQHCQCRHRGGNSPGKGVAITRAGLKR